MLLVTLVAFPFGMAIYFSLSDYWVGSPGAFVGLTNYRDILGNETFRQTVQNSFVFTGIALTLKIVLGSGSRCSCPAIFHSSASSGASCSCPS